MKLNNKIFFLLIVFFLSFFLCFNLSERKIYALTETTTEPGTSWSENDWARLFATLTNNYDHQDFKLYMDNVYSKYVVKGYNYDCYAQASGAVNDSSIYRNTDNVTLIRFMDCVSGCSITIDGVEYTEVRLAFMAFLKHIVNEQLEPSLDGTRDEDFGLMWNYQENYQIYEELFEELVEESPSINTNKDTGLASLSQIVFIITNSQLYSINFDEEGNVIGSPAINNETFELSDGGSWNTSWEIVDSNYGVPSGNWLSGVQSSISAFNIQVTFVRNVIIGISILVSFIILVINITKLALAGSNPFQRRRKQMDLLVSVVSISLIGSIEVVSYLLITIASG